MNDRAGRGVELPLHQPVLWLQLQHFVGIEDVLQWRPAALFVCSEDHGQFKCWRDTGVWVDAPHGLQAVLDLHVELDGGAPEPAGLVGRGVHHVLGDPGGHPAGQQQQLAAEGVSLGCCQTALDLLGHLLLKEPLLLLQTRVQGGNCREKPGRLNPTATKSAELLADRIIKLS